MAEEITKSRVVELGFSAEPKAVDDAAIQIVRNINMQDVENVVDAFKEQAELLKQAQEFSELRAKYAALEAATYKRIVDRGWAKALNPNSYICKAAKWLASVPDKYEDVLRKILHGDGTLVSVWKEYCVTYEKAEYGKEALKKRREAITRYKESGRAYVDIDCRYEDYYLSQYFQAVSKTEEEYTEPEQIANAVEDSCRIYLRRLGAVGIGGGEYVDPKAFPEEVHKAIGIRRKNITSCVLRLKGLCDATESIDFYDELRKALNAAHIDMKELQ